MSTVLAVVPDASLIDSIDSHYMYVRTRLAQAVTLAPDGVTSVVGAYPAKAVVMALDWPPPNVMSNVFYLLTMDSEPIGSRGYSAALPMQFHRVMWKAIIVGDELTQGERAANRGTRYRTLWAMKEAFRQAMFPFFTEKLHFSLTGTPPNTVWSGVSKTPQQFITWNPPAVNEKKDDDSGTVEFSAMLRIWDTTDQIVS